MSLVSILVSYFKEQDDKLFPILIDFLIKNTDQLIRIFFMAQAQMPIHIYLISR